MIKTAIIVAGGTGSRLNPTTPKQFLLLDGKPMLMHSIEAFCTADPGISIIVALPEDHFSTWQNLCDQYRFDVPHRLAAGGLTRFHSVKNALAFADEEGLVAIHDAARPLVTVSLIRTAFLMAGQYGNCIPVIPLSDSVRRMTGDSSCPVSRTGLRIVQTPQVFLSALLKKAYMQEYRGEFTDDATVAEHDGVEIKLIDGDPVNFKITRMSDLAAAEAILRNI